MSLSPVSSSVLWVLPRCERRVLCYIRLVYKAQQVSKHWFPVVLAAALLGACGETGQPPPESQHAKNIILFVGDGMGVSTVTAARIFDGQSKGMSGEENTLSFENFPSVALVKTYSTNEQVAESAGTITAMLTGEKTRGGFINVGPQVKGSSCGGAQEHPLTPISTHAKRHGKAVGVVTTTRITHATPAAVYANAPDRYWEDDSSLPPGAWQQGCRDIAFQLINSPEGGLDVAMGGGSRHFFGSDRFGERRDAADDLVREWLGRSASRRYVSAADQLGTLQPGNQVLGLFAQSHLGYVAEKTEDSTEPSLAEMTTTAIRLMAENDAGYFLLVEGGRIDHGHHASKAGYALIETQEFARAVQAALDMIDLEDTLVLVTADHSHVFTMGGYTTRGNPILGLVVMNDENGEPRAAPELAADGQPYTTLAYADGPGAVTTMPRPAPEIGVDALTQSLVPLATRYEDGSIDYDETHGGEDVPLYAIGPGADAVGGVIEQDLIYDIMLTAYGWTD